MNDDSVIDASAFVLALIGKTDAADRLRQRLHGMHLHAPHLIDAEVGNVLRRHERAGKISGFEAATALRAGAAMIRHRYPHTGSLAKIAWDLRTNVSFYDALYVALACGLDVPLITADARLSRAPGVPCEVEVA